MPVVLPTKSLTSDPVQGVAEPAENVSFFGSTPSIADIVSNQANSLVIHGQNLVLDLPEIAPISSLTTVSPGYYVDVFNVNAIDIITINANANNASWVNEDLSVVNSGGIKLSPSSSYRLHAVDTTGLTGISGLAWFITTIHGVQASVQQTGTPESISWSTTADKTVALISDPTAIAGDCYQLVNNDTGTTTAYDSAYVDIPSQFGVDVTQTHTITFRFKIQKPITEFTGGDFIDFFGDDGPTPLLGGGNSWQFRLQNSGGFQRIRVRNGAGFFNSTFVPVQDRWVDVTVVSRPASGTFDLTLSDGVQANLVNTARAMRDTTPNTQNVFAAASRERTSGATVTFCIDNLKVVN